MCPHNLTNRSFLGFSAQQINCTLHVSQVNVDHFRLCRHVQMLPMVALSAAGIVAICRAKHNEKCGPARSSVTTTSPYTIQHCPMEIVLENVTAFIKKQTFSQTCCLHEDRGVLDRIVRIAMTADRSATDPLQQMFTKKTSYQFLELFFMRSSLFLMSNILSGSAAMESVVSVDCEMTEGIFV